VGATYVSVLDLLVAALIVACPVASLIPLNSVFGLLAVQMKVGLHWLYERKLLPRQCGLVRE
jgi:hypothetical protein